MKRYLYCGMSMALLLAFSARAQLGMNEAECAEEWGVPQETHSLPGNVRSSSFVKDSLTVNIDFLDKIARKAIYRQEDLDITTVKQILAINTGSATWNEWESPGQTDQDENRDWVRSDEGAVANFKKGELTITSAEWTQRPSPESVVETSTGSTTPPPDLTPPDIAGFWRSDSSISPYIVLHIQTNGLLLWIEYGEDERNEIRIGWKRESADGPQVVTLRDYQPGAPASASLLGSLQADSPKALRFTAVRVPGKPGLNGLRYSNVAFDRIARLPLWKPRGPESLPAKGDTREEAIRLLGKPMGMMSIGGREALAYPWGNVWIKNGLVIGVD